MTRSAISAAALALACALAISACTTKSADSARVDCGAPGPNGVECNIVRTGGEGAFQACWDLAITCQNQGKMTGAACHEVGAGVPSGTQLMPVSSFDNQDACDVPASGAVENLKIVSR